MRQSKNTSLAEMKNEYIQYQQQRERVKKLQKKKLFRRLTVFGGLALVVSFFLVSMLVERTYALQQKQEELAQVNEELKQLKDEQNSLENQIVKLNDDEYIAKVARSTFFFSGDGEIIFSLPEDKKGNKGTE
ncbi:FtsB family cell division protein [Mangrovibacillus cuniculi]|uniref:Septum formation initiator family protein n=1 Tax=Mangrovibacillus cuniculi TaxID=2593652 RepID=A0A7S8CDH0_9BACI|nr:septum formation initiator family protein [Mangrovibacillus cuniculi]QPC47986.1 septum formation initiator family protein [Mangrovibacillus cuniculi]